MNIQGKSSIYHKLVYEVRYPQGMIYLDRCGSTCNRITAMDPNWMIKENSINPQNAPMFHLSSGIQFNFGPDKFSFSLDQPINKEAALGKQDIENFIAQVHSVSEIVQDQLELNKFSREGFRVWYLFSSSSKEESRKWISQLGVFSISPSVSSAFNGTIDSEGYTLVIKGKERMFRISVNPVEKLETLDTGNASLRTLPRNLPRAQKEAAIKQWKAKNRLLANPEFAVMIDVDAYIEDPYSIASREFINDSLDLMESSLPNALNGEKL